MRILKTKERNSGLKSPQRKLIICQNTVEKNEKKKKKEKVRKRLEKGNDSDNETKKYRQLTKDMSKRKMEQDKKYGKKGVGYLLT